MRQGRLADRTSKLLTPDLFPYFWDTLGYNSRSWLTLLSTYIYVSFSGTNINAIHTIHNLSVTPW